MLNQPSNPKLIIGSRRTGSIGELKVPGDHQIPAKPCSPTPSTRPHDPNRNYKPSSHQQKRTEESFLQVSSAPISSKNSTDATTSTNAAVSAAPQAKQTTTFGINTVPRLPPYALSTEQCGGRSAEGLGCFASHLTHATAAKTTFTKAAVTAARLTRPEAASSSYARNRGSPHQRDSLGESPPNPHDKRNAAYCRAIDIARVQDFKRYAILIVVDIDETATAFVPEQFRLWTLSRPQTTSVTIETAVWSLFRISLHEAQILPSGDTQCIPRYP